MTPTQDPTIVEQATNAARAVVEKSFSKVGLAASSEGYPQVWTRDAVITFLGAAVDKNPDALLSFRKSLETLGSNQDRWGQVPTLVHIADSRGEYGALDSNPWFVIGVGYYVELSGDEAWAREWAPKVEKALDWCEAMDRRKRGMLSSGESCDWADLMANHGHVLFPNALYVRALEAAANMMQHFDPDKAKAYRARREAVVAAIQNDLWVRSYEDVHDKDRTHEKTQAHMSLALRRRPFFLPWVDGFDYGERFDTTANLMAIMTGVATDEQAGKILDYIDQIGLNRPYPVRVLYPPIERSDRDWREYYKIWNLNLPHQYHNGGIWPWVGGLYIAALVHAGRRDQAREELALLAEALRLGQEEWECNEYLHGLSGKPMGVKLQAWSAGMFLYALHAVTTGTTPGLSGKSDSKA